MPREKRRQPPKKDKRNKFSASSKKVISWANFTRVFLPSLVLLLIILTPVLFERFKTRHQKTSEIIEAPVPGDWFDDLFNGGAPGQDIDPDEDEFDDGGFLDGFTNGLNDPERILFRISPADHFLYWRLQVYDRYTMEAWDRNITSTIVNGYSSIPSYADGEFSVTSDLAYTGGTLVGNFPAPYNFQYGEDFSEDYYFTPSDDWIPEATTLEEDQYGCKLFNSRFIPQFGNTTLNYNVAYTLQDNDYLKDNSGDYSALQGLIQVNQELEDDYLQLPTNYTNNAPTTFAIANELFDPSTTIYNQIMRNMMWLTQNATYDLDMLMGQSDASPAPGEDYVEWFLSRRMGTAAHFASALAIISRIQNIPSRVVVGFSYGEQEGDEFIIRAKHAHSWVEVFLPIIGDRGYWVQFDPSPLIPGLRDQYGENVNSFQFVFYCSNEFFLSEEHMYRLPTPPYFVPNSASDAWYPDPYDPSNWYGPYVNRTEPFEVNAFLGSGTNEDLLNYILTGDPGELIPIEGEQIDFIDSLTGNLIGTAITDSDGFASTTYSFPISAPSGLHQIVADWEGLQVPTYDLRYISDEEFIETGVIVTGKVNISSSDSIEKINYFSQLHHSSFFSPIFSLISVICLEKRLLMFIKKSLNFFHLK
ncbi:MAG: hypothetical protein GF308_16120 [Candidatus Heimdallarchaeota archaeon]|nr:hypothetical protein [Candidatus Heimdallarchaeota archaeon]